MAKEITSLDEFRDFVGENSSSIIALNFWASWAAPCQQMNSVFDSLKDAYKDVAFAKIEAENVPDIAETFDVSSVPLFVIIKNQKVLSRVTGANPPELTAALSKATGAPVTNGHSEQSEQDIETKLKELVSASNVMLFMKGVPSAPQCGFSRTMVGLLRDRNVKFGYFNILADDAVRSGMKKFADWPTFPMLWVNGEFVGGLDIVQEMIANNQFDELVAAH